MDPIVTVLAVIIGLVAFVALMQLFPISMRLGQIRDKLYEKEIAKEKAELAQAVAEQSKALGGRPPA